VPTAITKPTATATPDEDLTYLQRLARIRQGVEPLRLAPIQRIMLNVRLVAARLLIVQDRYCLAAWTLDSFEDQLRAFAGTPLSPKAQAVLDASAALRQDLWNAGGCG
jgi:hypothetical protein